MTLEACEARHRAAVAAREAAESQLSLLGFALRNVLASDLDAEERMRCAREAVIEAVVVDSHIKLPPKFQPAHDHATAASLRVLLKDAHNEIRRRLRTAEIALIERNLDVEECLALLTEARIAEHRLLQAEALKELAKIEGSNVNVGSIEGQRSMELQADLDRALAASERLRNELNFKRSEAIVVVS